MAIAVVQTKTTATLLNDQTATLGAAATNGNTLIVVGFISSNTQTLSVTDNGGSITWASVVGAAHSTGQIRVELFWGAVSGAPTVITMNSSGTGLTTLHVVEVSGLHASPVDVSGSGETTTAGPSHNISSAITPSQADVILVGGVGSTNAASYTLPGSFARIDVVADRSDAGTDIVSSIAAYDFATTSVGSELTISVLAAFKADGGGPLSLSPAQAAAALTGNVFGMGFKINMPDEL